MRRPDELHMDFPFAGSRMLRDLLAVDCSKASILSETKRSKGRIKRSVTSNNASAGADVLSGPRLR